MSKAEHKIEKKRAKAEAKIAKARAKAETVKASSASGLPPGVGVSIQRRDDASDLVVTGLRDDQLERVLPHVAKEVLIAVTAEKSSFRAGMMRMAREGLFQTLIKVIAGLIVGLLLVRFGLR
jgi:hypothetical protein